LPACEPASPPSFEEFVLSTHHRSVLPAAILAAGSVLLASVNADAQDRADARPIKPRSLLGSAPLAPASRIVSRDGLSAQGAPNPRLLPDISVVGDLIADLSPDGTTQEDGTRMGVREIELALQAAVDPSFRGDVFIGFSDAEGVGIEQAFMTATSLPWQLEMRLGRFLAPFGKQNTTHRHDLHTVDHALVNQRLLGEEGLKGTGLWLGRIFAPFGFYQEIIVTATERLGEAPEDLTTAEPTSRHLGDLAYGARLRNYWDLSNAANLEVSGSVLTGRREHEAVPLDDVNAVALRETTIGTDVTFRWRPPQQGLYKSFILQAEFLTRSTRTPDVSIVVPGETPTEEIESLSGFYLFGRYQISRRAYLGARLDALDDPEFGGVRTTGLSGYYQFYPSEFSKIIAKFERVSPSGLSAINRLVLQATFALGPHKPHPF
jgi:hypothetical protein